MAESGYAVACKATSTSVQIRLQPQMNKQVKQWFLGAIATFFEPFRKQTHKEPNPVYHKKFWREVRENDNDDYPGPMPM